MYKNILEFSLKTFIVFLAVLIFYYIASPRQDCERMIERVVLKDGADPSDDGIKDLYLQGISTCRRQTSW